jgi:hypothetical protein
MPYYTTRLIVLHVKVSRLYELENCFLQKPLHFGRSELYRLPKLEVLDKSLTSYGAELQRVNNAILIKQVPV